MFDDLVCEYPLPDGNTETKFQTKSLNCFMDQYAITREGRLVENAYRIEPIPDEQNEYYGTPEWDDPLHRFWGSRERVELGPVDTEYHGDIVFYNGSVEYTARFTEGQLQWIKRMDAQP